MFQQIDLDQNQKIDLNEWLHFWASVKGSNYSENEIFEVLSELEEKKGWVVFQNLKKK